MRALIRAPSNRAPTGIRNRALLVLLYRGGLRISEALSIGPADIDRDAGTVVVLYGKGSRRRTIALDPGAFAVLERWLDRRRTLGLARSRTVFCTLQGGPMDSSYVRHLLPRLAAKAGIERRVHPHALRHTHAAELAREGKPITLVRDQLGHKSVATTDAYLRHVAPQELVDAMRSRTWDL